MSDIPAVNIFRSAFIGPVCLCIIKERMSTMICPHCGKNTQSKGLCDHCKMPTEFTARSSIRPGRIPGMEEPPPRPAVQEAYHPPKRKSSRLLVIITVLALIALVTATIVCFVLLRLSLTKIKSSHTPEPTVYQTEPPVTEPRQQEYLVIFDYNFPRQTSFPDRMPTIGYGERIPLPSEVDGYVFCGWNTDPDGNGTFFRANDLFMIPLSADLTLYGQWEEVVWEPELWEHTLEEPTEAVLPEETADSTAPSDSSDQNHREP